MYPVSVKDRDSLRGVTSQTLMKNFSRLILILVIMLLAGGGVFLMIWEIPAPTHTIERDLTDVRSPR